ncbi:MAG TPA: hypothetical protein VN915_12255 [Elusimicrobiota bacterium]|nr:hypothetical protein [Elusimicrobiota bacterium]
MTRAELRERIDSLKPSRIAADLYADPLMRSMARVRERAAAGYKKALLALYADRGLTDVQRTKGYCKALEIEAKMLKKLEPLEKRFQEEVYIPLMVETGVLKGAAAKSSKRRSK